MNYETVVNQACDAIAEHLKTAIANTADVEKALLVFMELQDGNELNALKQAVYNLQDERTKELITRELTNMETKAMNIYNNELIFKDVMESADAMLTALKGTEAENAARDFKEHLTFEFFTANTAGEPIGNIEKVIEEVASFTNLLNKIRGGMYFLGIIFSSAYKKQEMLTK